MVDWCRGLRLQYIQIKHNPLTPIQSAHLQLDSTQISGPVVKFKQAHQPFKIKVKTSPLIQIKVNSFHHKSPTRGSTSQRSSRSYKNVTKSFPKLQVNTKSFLKYIFDLRISQNYERTLHLPKLQLQPQKFSKSHYQLKIFPKLQFNPKFFKIIFLTLNFSKLHF